MRIFDKYKGNKYSQNGEDLILEEIFKRLKIKKGNCCEFGAANGMYCSNTFALIEQGWKGKMIEVDASFAKALIDNTMKYGVELYFGKVTPENANLLIPGSLNLLSIDCDNPDWHIWKAYTGIADVVVIEINSSIAPGIEMIPGSAGASYTSMVKLGIEKGYFLLAHTGNLILILNKHRDLFPEIEGDGLTNADLYFDKSWLP